MDNSSRVLVVVDLSNWIYYTVCGAFSLWSKSSPNASIIRPAKDTDQDNLPDLLVFKDFKQILHNNIHRRLETVKYIAKQNHQDEIDNATDIDIIFTIDDDINNNFRKIKYPGYKAQRKLTKKQYNVSKIRDYVRDVALPELHLETKYGYNFVKVEGCESDDIIATIMKNFTDYACRIIISSDHDFLQIPNVHQYDMFGKKITREVDGKELSERDFLLWKIIRGDVSDNISGVFEGVGEKRALKLVDDREKLKSMLKESKDSTHQYILNKYLIDFRNIPAELEKNIVDVVTVKLESRISETTILDDLDDISSF